MKNPLILELLGTMNTKQRQQFDRFLMSPYFNVPSRLQQAYKLLSHSSFLEQPDHLKNSVFTALFPGEPYTDSKIRLLYSDLLQQLKIFLFIENQRNNQDAQELHLVKYLRRAKKIKLFERTASSLKAKLLQSRTWNPEAFDALHEIDMEIMSHESFKNRFSIFNFQESAETLEISALIKRLRIYLEQLSHEALTTTRTPYPLLEESILLAREKKWDQHPELKIYLQAVQLFTEPERTEYFHRYLDVLKKHEQEFDFERERELYLTALNYGIRKINKNIPEFFRITLDLFRHGVKKGWLLDYGVMSSLTYKNIIVLCIRMNDLKLAITVLEEYKNLVDVSERNMIYQFCLARIYKEQGLFQKALYLLNTSLFKDPLIELNARVEMIKIYYETQETDLMQNQILSTKSLIRRSKKLGYHRPYYEHFLNHARRLYQTIDISKQECENWVREIETEKQCIEKNWLLSRVALVPVRRNAS